MCKKRRVFLLARNEGFSLVELMVVVAIIGILASVAVPQFQKFTFKARLTEASAGLSSLYTAEKAFYAEWSEFDTRFGVIGYAPEGTYSFNIGFAGANVASTNWKAVNNTGSTINNVNSFCNLAANAGRCKTMDSVPTNVTALASTYLAGAKVTTSGACTVENAAGTNSVFMACASAKKDLNPEHVAVNLAINQSKDFRSSVP